MPKNQSIAPLLIMIGISIIPFFAIHFPRMLGFWPVLLGVIISIWYVFENKQRLHLSRPYLICTIAISALCILSSLWAISPMASFEKSLRVMAILVGGVFLFSSLRIIDIDRLRPYLIMLPIGVSFAALLSSLDLALGIPIYRLTHDRSFDENISTAVMNRGIITTMLLSFISLFFIKASDQSEKLKKRVKWCMFASIFTMLMLTQSQSAQLAYILGVVTFFIFPSRYKIAYKLLTLIIIAAILSTPWLTQFMFHYIADSAGANTWLKDAYAASRMEIWDFVSRFAMQNPLYGFGLEATRQIVSFDHAYLYHKEASVLHPHNFSVQIWMEFGLVGAIIACLFFAFIIKQISAMPANSAQITMAVFISVLSISATGYGIWQSWWLGEIILLSALCVRLTNNGEPPQQKLNQAKF